VIAAPPGVSPRRPLRPTSPGRTPAVVPAMVTSLRAGSPSDHSWRSYSVALESLPYYAPIHGRPALDLLPPTSLCVSVLTSIRSTARSGSLSSMAALVADRQARSRSGTSVYLNPDDVARRCCSDRQNRTRQTGAPPDSFSDQERLDPRAGGLRLLYSSFASPNSTSASSPPPRAGSDDLRGRGRTRSARTRSSALHHCGPTCFDLCSVRPPCRRGQRRSQSASLSAPRPSTTVAAYISRLLLDAYPANAPFSGPRHSFVICRPQADKRRRTLA